MSAPKSPSTPESPAAVAANLFDELYNALGQRIKQQPHHLVSDVITSWAKILEVAYRTAIGLWRIPIEMIDAEDRTLSAHGTSLNFPATKGTPQLRCTEARLVQQTPAAAFGATTLAAEPDVSGTVVLSTPQPLAGGHMLRVVVTLPRAARAGLYRLTIKNDAGSESQTYLHPFGVPGVGH
jgi:hypothetical protein